MKKAELRYLQRLAELYPTIGKASTEIINPAVDFEPSERHGAFYVGSAW